MANKRSNIEIIFSARDVNLNTVITKGRVAIKAFTDQVDGSSGAVASMRTQVLQLAGAFAGLSAIGDVGTMLQEADRNAYGLATSIQAANREFKVGSAAEWEQTITSLSDKLKIYSQSDIRGAAAATIDMTKRLGLNADQMKRVIALSGDLAAGRTDLAGAVERVTAALRGEAEASEYLGLTLNETYVKGWYEAHGAMQGAWKDLNDLQKAQVRYNVFLEQSLPLQGKAAGSINTYDGALKLIRKTVTDSITTNEDLIAALARIAQVLRENSTEIGVFVSSMASGAGRVIEFVAANREVILTVGKYSVIFGTAVTVIGKLIATTQGLNAAFTILTGTGIVPWLRSVEAGSIAATIGVTGLKIGFVGLMGAAAAFYAAYNAGEWLTMRSEMQGIAQAQAELARNTKLITAEFRKISQATGETITSMKELDKAVADGRIHYDELTGTWKKGSKEQQDSTKQTAATMKQVTGEALKAMQEQYKAYADQVKSLQEEITNRQKSLTAELREMGRAGMSDIDAWKDRKKEAGEYFAAAQVAIQQGKAALQAGDQATASLKFNEAKQLADDAKNAYKTLNTEVKDGSQVLVDRNTALKTAMDGMKQAGELAIGALTEQRNAAAGAMDSLVAKAGFADLAQGLDQMQQAWLTNWQNMQAQSLQSIQAVDEQIVKMVTPERTVWVNVRTKVLEDAKRVMGEESAETPIIAQHSLGGLIQRLAAGGGVRSILAGGHFPGYGGGDRRLVLAEDGEVMLRKESVRTAGLRAALAFNAGRFDVVLAELARRSRARIGYQLGGFVSSLPEIPTSVQRLASGGPVQGAAPAASRVVEVRFAGGQVQGDERSVEMLLQHLETAGLSA